VLLTLRSPKLVDVTYKYSVRTSQKTVYNHEKDQPSNAVGENNRCLLWQQYETHKLIARTKCKIPSVKPGGVYSNMGNDIV
jgi:hypothetical protein